MPGSAPKRAGYRSSSKAGQSGRQCGKGGGGRSARPQPALQKGKSAAPPLPKSRPTRCTPFRLRIQAGVEVELCISGAGFRRRKRRIRRRTFSKALTHSKNAQQPCRVKFVLVSHERPPNAARAGRPLLQLRVSGGSCVSEMRVRSLEVFVGIGMALLGTCCCLPLSS